MNSPTLSIEGRSGILGSRTKPGAVEDRIVHAGGAHHLIHQNATDNRRKTEGDGQTLVRTSARITENTVGCGK